MKGNLISIDRVRKELFDKNDDLKLWCRENLPDDFFKNTSEIINEYQKVITWTFSRSSHYSQNAINEFFTADKADAFIFAYALSDIATKTIVAQKLSTPKMKGKIKISELCNVLNMFYMKGMEMFREF